jgi:hypothetical protein
MEVAFQRGLVQSPNGNLYTGGTGLVWSPRHGRTCITVAYPGTHKVYNFVLGVRRETKEDTVGDTRA